MLGLIVSTSQPCSSAGKADDLKDIIFLSFIENFKENTCHSPWGQTRDSPGQGRWMFSNDLTHLTLRYWGHYHNFLPYMSLLEERDLWFWSGGRRNLDAHKELCVSTQPIWLGAHRAELKESYLPLGGQVSLPSNLLLYIPLHFPALYAYIFVSVRCACRK